MNFTIKPYKINDYLELRFEVGETVIYVNSKPFRICKYLFLVDPQNNPSQDSIDSIDEAKQALNGNLEGNEVTPAMLGISKEEVFWGHCSNLQAWYELDYDTRVLHSNLSFPLLEALSNAGDVRAKNVFKEEVAKRFMDGYLPVVFYLLEMQYLEYLRPEEKEDIIAHLTRLYNIHKTSLTQYEVGLLLTELCGYYVRKKRLSRASIFKEKLEKLTNTKHFARLWERIGEYYFEIEDLIEAELAFGKSLKLDENLDRAWVCLALLQANINPRGPYNYSRAVNFSIKAIELVKNNAFVWEMLGNIYEEAEEFNWAVWLYHKAIAYDWENFNAWYNIGRCFEELGNYSSAHRAYMSSLKHGLADCQKLNNIAHFFVQRGDFFNADKIISCINPSKNYLNYRRKSLSFAPSNLVRAVVEQLLLLEPGVCYSAQQLKPLVRFSYHGMEPISLENLYEMLKKIAYGSRSAITYYNDDREELSHANSLRYLKNSQMQIELLDGQRFYVVKSPFSNNVPGIYNALLYIKSHTSRHFRYCSLPARFNTDEFKGLKGSHYKVKGGKWYRLDRNGEYIINELFEIVEELLEGTLSMQGADVKLNTESNFKFYLSFKDFSCNNCDTPLNPLDTIVMNNNFDYSLNEEQPLISEFVGYCRNCFRELKKYQGLTHDDALVLNSLEKRIGKPIPPVYYYGAKYFGYMAKNGRVVGLSLYKCGLETIPKEVFSLSKLERLGLKKNKLSFIPDKIGSLTSLVELEISNNELRKVSDKIGKLINLERLYLCSNKLTEVPVKLAKLTRLFFLCLESNRLNSIPATFVHLIGLGELDLSDNKFTRFPDSLPDSLSVLRLSRNKISEFPSSMDRLSSLKALNLTKNELRSLPISLKSLESLEELDLERNRFYRVPLVCRELNHLNTLDLSANPIILLPYWTLLIENVVCDSIEETTARIKAYWNASEELIVSISADKRFKVASKMFSRIYPYLPLLYDDNEGLIEELKYRVFSLEQAGDFDMAIVKVKCLLGIFPGFRIFLWKLLELYDQNNQIEEAKTVYQNYKENYEKIFFLPLRKSYLNLWRKIDSEGSSIYYNARRLDLIVSKFISLLKKDPKAQVVIQTEKLAISYLWNRFCKMYLGEEIPLIQKDTWQDLSVYLATIRGKNSITLKKALEERYTSIWVQYKTLVGIGCYLEVLDRAVTKANVDNFLSHLET